MISADDAFAPACANNATGAIGRSVRVLCGSRYDLCSHTASIIHDPYYTLFVSEDLKTLISARFFILTKLSRSCSYFVTCKSNRVCSAYCRHMNVMQRRIQARRQLTDAETMRRQDRWDRERGNKEGTKWREEREGETSSILQEGEGRVQREASWSKGWEVSQGKK